MLAYYDPNKPATIEVDASGVALGAVLLQEGRPVAYASKALTETEKRYANIEREMLAVVFGCERFHTYVYGRCFDIVSDHKPLEMILQNSISNAPARLQRMLMRTANYNFTLKYRAGKTLLVSDALSRLPVQNSEPVQEIAMDICVSLVQFSPDRLKELREATQEDETLQELRRVILTGWPARMSEVHSAMRDFWSVRDSLVIDDGLIVRGTCVLIPRSKFERMIGQV